MKPPIAAFGLTLTCLLFPASTLPLAHAQAVPNGPPPTPSPSPYGGSPPAPPSTTTPGYGGSTAPGQPRLFAEGTALPEPNRPEEGARPLIHLPDGPVEPYLLTREQGPFMVTAKTFRGPDAERCALALVLELRRDYGLPAYILRIKDFPNRSNIRNVPPTAPSYVRTSQLTEPEKVRSYDEATVLVGNAKTLAESEALWLRVKKIKPKCLNEIPNMWGHRDGLSKALRTTNPYVPAQDIFPGRSKKDELVARMNGGPRSIFNCPGRYVLQIAEFGGRSVYNPDPKDPRLFDYNWLRTSPLVRAADDAERLAEALGKDPDIQRTGYQPYVYHSRTSSKVVMGSFNDPNDPNAVKLRDTLIKIAIPLADRMHKKRLDDIVIAPANQLTDLEDPSNPIKKAP
jgi:hypothetical protein